MIDTIEKLNEKFNNKYQYLKLLSVTYDTDTNQCQIILLYPYQIDEIPIQDKEEITMFYQEFLSLEGEVKIKFKKSFLDSRLIINEVVEYFKNNKKAIYPYISEKNIFSTYSNQDVKIKISLNHDILNLIDSFELANAIKNHIEKLFIANANVDIFENEEMLPQEILADDILPEGKKIRRYDVKIEKPLFGGEIVPRPEFIGDISNPAQSVILAGVIVSKIRKTFIAKKGKHVGEEKVFYVLNLKDKEGGSIEAVCFCSKTQEKILESLEDMFMVVCLGDVKNGYMGKLSYTIRKMAIASPVDSNIIEEATQKEQPYVHKKVVFPDAMPSETQTNLFEDVKKYNDFIMKNNIVVFDIETTGLDPDMCEITEIGAVKIEHGEITQRFSSFCKPKESIPLQVQELTGITDEMVANAPRVEDVVYDFYEWSRDCVISGYNIVGFDLKFIKKVADKIGIKFDNEIIDAFIVAKQAPIHPSNYKLGTVAKMLGVSLVDAHRAYNDANATAQVLMELNKLK